jgi:hypothetical protein
MFYTAEFCTWHTKQSFLTLQVILFTYTYLLPLPYCQYLNTTADQTKLCACLSLYYMHLMRPSLKKTEKSEEDSVDKYLLFTLTNPNLDL